MDNDNPGSINPWLINRGCPLLSGFITVGGNTPLVMGRVYRSRVTITQWLSWHRNFCCGVLKPGDIKEGQKLAVGDAQGHLHIQNIPKRFDAIWSRNPEPASTEFSWRATGFAINLTMNPRTVRLFCWSIESVIHARLRLIVLFGKTRAAFGKRMPGHNR